MCEVEQHRPENQNLDVHTREERLQKALAWRLGQQPDSANHTHVLRASARLISNHAQSMGRLRPSSVYKYRLASVVCCWVGMLKLLI